MVLSWNLLMDAASNLNPMARQAVMEIIKNQLQQDLRDLGFFVFETAVATTHYNGVIPSLWTLEGPEFGTGRFHRGVHQRAMKMFQGRVDEIIATGNPIVSSPDFCAERLVREIARTALCEKMLDYLAERGLVDLKRLEAT